MTVDVVDQDGSKPGRLLALLTPEQREVVRARRSRCGPCSQNQKLGVVSVQCKACGCAGVSLIHGRCKLRKWPTGLGSAMQVRASQPNGSARDAPKCLILQSGLSPGDIVTLTASVAVAVAAGQGRSFGGGLGGRDEKSDTNPLTGVLVPVR